MTTSVLSSINAFLFGSTVHSSVTKKTLIPYSTEAERETLILDLMAKGYQFPIEMYDGLKIAPETERKEYDIVVQDDAEGSFIANGVRYHLPQKILDRSALYINGVTNMSSFPLDITTVGQHGKAVYIALGGFDLCEPSNETEHSLQYNALTRSRGYYDAQKDSTDIDLVRGEMDGLRFACSVCPEYIYLYVEYPESDVTKLLVANVHISQYNTGQLDNTETMLQLAFDYARVFMLTNAKLNQPVGRFDENRIAQTIFALFLADKE